MEASFIKRGKDTVYCLYLRFDTDVFMSTVNVSITGRMMGYNKVEILFIAFIHLIFFIIEFFFSFVEKICYY